MENVVEPDKIADAFDGFKVEERSFGADGYEQELAKSFEVLLTPTSVQGVQNEEFFTPLPNAELGRAEESDHHQPTEPTSNLPSGRIIRRASRRSSILKIVHPEAAAETSDEIKEPKDSGCSSKVPPPNGIKKSTKFTKAAATSKTAALPKDRPVQFRAQPVPRRKGSNPSLPRAPTTASVVLEHRDGMPTKKTVNTHVGVPQSGYSGVRKLAVKPFSFVERDEKARKLREQKLKQAFEESVTFPKFKANPLPSYMAEKTIAVPSSSKTLNKNEHSDEKEGKENLPSQD